MLRFDPKHCVGLLVACLWLFHPGEVRAGRDIGIFVTLDGKQILLSASGDNGTPGPGTVWRYLKTTPLSPRDGFKVLPLPDQPLIALLKGKVVVEVNYGGKVETSELKLIRKRVDNDSWHIDPDWVEANGPPKEPEPPAPAQGPNQDAPHTSEQASGNSSVLWWVLGDGLLLVGLLIMVVWRQRKIA